MNKYVGMPANLKQSAIFPWLGLALVAAFGVAWLTMATRLGAGTSPDSVTYIGVADQLLRGKGFTVPFGDTLNAPLSQFPPLFSTLLTLPGLLGIPTYIGARWIQIFLYLSNLALIFILLKGFAQPNPWRALAGTCILAISPSFLHAHQMVWSEGFFLLLVLCALLFFVNYLRNRVLALLILAGMVFGLTILTRYAGLAILSGAALTLFIIQKYTIARRFISIGILLTSAAVLPAFWLLYQILTTGASTGRSFGIHWIERAQVQQAIDTIGEWLLLPNGLSAGAILIFAFILIAVPMILLIHREGVRTYFRDRPLPLLLTILMVTYLAFLVLSISFLDANTPLDTRLLLPELVFVVILFFRLLWQRRSLPRSVSITIGVVISIWGIVAVLINFSWAQQLAQSGNNYTVAPWHSTVLQTTVRLMTETQPIYTNAPEALYLQTGHPSLRLPKKIDLMSQTVNADFPQALRAAADTTQQQQGIWVYYKHVQGKTIATQAELQQFVPSLTILVQDDTVVLYTFHSVAVK